MRDQSAVHVAQVPKNRPTTVLAETNQQYVEAMKFRRNGTIEPNSTVLFDRSNQPELITDIIDEPLSGIKVFHNFPKDVAEFRVLHPEVSEEVLSRNLAAYQKLGKTLEDGGAIAISSLPGNRAYSLEENIYSISPSELVIIISHVPRQERLAGLGFPPYRSALITLTDGTVFDAIRNTEATSGSVVGDRYSRDGYPNFTLGDESRSSGETARRRLSWLIGCQTWDLFIGRPDFLSGSLVVTRPLTFQQGASAGLRLQGAATLRDAVNRLVIPSRAQPQSQPNERLGVDHPDPVPVQAPFAILAEVAPEKTLVSYETVGIA